MRRILPLALLPLMLAGGCDDPASTPTDWYSTNQVGYFSLTRTTHLYRDSTATEDAASAWFQSPDSIGVYAGRVTINGTEIPLVHAPPGSGEPVLFYKLSSTSGAAVPLQFGDVRHQFDAQGSAHVPALSAATYSPFELQVLSPKVTDTLSRSAGFRLEQKFAEAPLMPVITVQIVALGDTASIGNHIINKSYVESPNLDLRITPEELKDFPVGPVWIVVKRTRDLQAQTTEGRLFKTTITSTISYIVQMKE